jgi:hypothetical protein
MSENVADRSSLIPLAELEDLQQTRREAPDVQVVVQEQGGNCGAVEQVRQVAVGAHQALVPVVQLGIDRLELFIKRLQFLLRGFQLLVRRLQLLVGRQVLLVGGLQLLIGGLQFLGIGPKP